MGIRLIGLLILLFKAGPKRRVKLEIKQLVGKKSSDYMGLTNHLLKTINPVISGYLTDIFTKIIDESHYPKSLKVLKVVPIFKDRSK